MSPAMRKMALHGFATMIYQRMLQLAQEYREIRSAILDMRNNPESMKKIVSKEASKVLDELEANNHLEKIEQLTANMLVLRNEIADADAESDFTRFVPLIDEIQKQAEAHFEEFLPPLHKRLTQAMQHQMELN